MVAEVTRSPSTSPLGFANRVTGKQFEDLKNAVYEELLKDFSERHETRLYLQLFNELSIQDRATEQTRLQPFSHLTKSVRERLGGLGASLVHSGADVENILPEVLAQFGLGRGLAERVADLTPDELSLNLAAALSAVGNDKSVSDKVYFAAINALSERGQFTTAFLLLPHLYKPQEALIRVASCALRNGHPDIAVDAVRQ